MLKYLFCTLCLVSLAFPANAMKATAEVYQFQSADGPYVEIFFYIIGSTVVSSADSRKSVQVKYYIERDSGVYAGDKYNLVVDALGVSDFMDLRRHRLSPGEYQFRAEIRDNQDSTSIVYIDHKLNIMPGDRPAFSDVQLLSSAKNSSEQTRWTKNGIEVIPLPYSYCGSATQSLRVYTELYRMDEVVDGMYYLKYSINAYGLPDKAIMEKHKRMEPAPVSPVFQTIDISGLTSGSYELRVGAFDREHQLIAEAQVPFDRSNPTADSLMAINSGRYFEYSFTRKMDSDSLRYVLKALAPKISPTQMDALNYLIKKGEMEEQRRFIHDYWLQVNNADPQGAFKEYLEKVHYADRVFKSGFGHGFETDRGRIYLRYGAPNDVVSVEDEPSAPPYEIWIYENFPVTAQGVVKFLFYAPELANSYELLHSTCEQEIRNPAWEQMLYKDALSETSSGDLIDAREVPDNFNRRAREYFTDF